MKLNRPRSKAHKISSRYQVRALSRSPCNTLPIHVFYEFNLQESSKLVFNILKEGKYGTLLEPFSMAYHVHEQMIGNWNTSLFLSSSYNFAYSTYWKSWKNDSLKFAQQRRNIHNVLNFRKTIILLLIFHRTPIFNFPLLPVLLTRFSCSAIPNISP